MLHALSAFGVVTFGDLANPVPAMASTLGDVLGHLTSGQQPQDLPPTAFVRLFGRPVASLQFVDTHFKSEINSSSHASILQVPSNR